MSDDVTTPVRNELPIPARLAAIVLIFVGVSGIATGLMLFQTGSPPWLYLVTGAAFLASGFLILSRRKAGLYLFLAAAIATVVWHVAAGSPTGEIARRILLPAAIGAYLATPRVRMTLR
jgi:LPXTG-motif cell wall-anchored protein